MADPHVELVDETKEKSRIGLRERTTKAAIETKEFVEQASIETKQHVEAALAKVRGQTWSEPLGRACTVTAGIASGLGTFVPGFGIVGGALSLGASLLNPSATMNDVKRGKGENEANNSGTGSSEVKKDMEEVHAEVNELIKDIQRFSQSVDQEIKDIKDVVNRTFDIVVDTRYKVFHTVLNFFVSPKNQSLFMRALCMKNLDTLRMTNLRMTELTHVGPDIVGQF